VTKPAFPNDPTQASVLISSFPHNAFFTTSTEYIWVNTLVRNNML